MEFWSSIFGKVIDITASIIVAVAVHIPFLMGLLIIAPSEQVAPVTTPPEEKPAAKVTTKLVCGDDYRTPVSTSTPADWKTYENADWCFEIKYPPTWAVKETKVPAGALSEVRLTGDGYSIRIDKSGRGVPEDNWTHPHYIIGSYEVRSWEKITDTSLSQLLSMYPAAGEKYLLFGINGPPSKEITDLILGSVRIK